MDVLGSRTSSHHHAPCHVTIKAKLLRALAMIPIRSPPIISAIGSSLCGKRWCTISTM
jgi:hypothetical protein